MNSETRLIEFRDRNGGLIFSFFVTAKPSPGGPEETRKNPPQKGEGKPKNPELMMTDAQKRYLFRLLAEQGKEEEEAHDYLKEFFQVKSLKEVPRIEASQAIERLLVEAGGGEGNDRPPF